MERWLVKINDDYKVKEKLEEFGSIEEVSELMSLYSLKGKDISINKVKNIKGVLSIEKDAKGNLMVI